MDHDRHGCVIDHGPHVVQQRVVGIVVTDLQMCLEDSCSGAYCVVDIARRIGLGVEGGRREAVRCRLGESDGPFVQPARHLRPVRVDQRREPSHAEPPQRLDPLGLVAAVCDRPGPPDKRPGSVEMRPHLVEHPLGHEMRMDVDNSGQPQRRPDLAYVGGHVGSPCRCASAR